MKKLIFLSLLHFIGTSLFGQDDSDSLSYQAQRKKINTLLARRAEKFGLYDESLQMRSGIFGQQTKEDIRHSNDLLEDIVKTDDTIYNQVKILLDFTSAQQEQSLNRSREMAESGKNYRAAINSLRAQVNRLKAGSKKQQQDKENPTPLFAIIVILSLISIFILVTSRKTGVTLK
jgi:hypothetical protein